MAEGLSARAAHILESGGAAMAPIQYSQFETHLDICDLDRSVAFYRDVVGLEPAYRLWERNVAFLWAGGQGRSMVRL